jgi:hypothetical protein
VQLCRTKHFSKFDVSFCFRIALEFNGWESHFTLLHIVVDGLIEILAHVSFENNGEVVPVPLTLCSGLQWLHTY